MRRIFQIVGLSFFILFLLLIKLMKLTLLSLFLFLSSHSSEMKNISFIPASDYPTVGEAIRPFEYSRWGLVYVVLINAQQG